MIKIKRLFCSLFLIPLEWTHEGQLIGGGLEATMTKFGRGVDEFKIDLFQSCSLRVGQQALSQSENSLLRPNTATLDHQKVIVDLSVMRETAHWSDTLFCQVILRRRVVDDLLAILDVNTFSDSVDFLVHLSTMMVALLTSTGDGELNARWMPGSDTSDFPQTLVRLPRQFLTMPTRSNTLCSLALGDSDDIDHLILSKDAVDWHWLLQMFLGPIQFLRDASTVKLDFHDVCLLLSLFQQLHLGVSDDPDDTAILLHDFEVMLDLLLAQDILPFLAGFGERLLLALVPVLVEPTTTIFAKMFSPDEFKSTETMRSIDVADNTNCNHWRSFNDGHGLNDFLLVHL